MACGRERASPYAIIILKPVQDGAKIFAARSESLSTAAECIPGAQQINPKSSGLRLL